MNHPNDSDQNPPFISGHQGWWTSIAVISFIFGFIFTGGLAPAVGFMIGAFLFPGLVVVAIWAIFKLARRPLTTNQLAKVFVILWIVMMGLNLVDRV